MTDTWRKASYSVNNGQCVEVGWRKASYSGGNGQCVEVGQATAVLVRDTRDRDGVTLAFPGAAWAEFTAGLRSG